MGNRALRKAASEALGRRVYRGNRNVACRTLRARKLKRLINDGSFKPGAVVHDCDGFNHHVGEAVVLCISRPLPGINGTTVVREVELVSAETGNVFCSCAPLTSGVVATREVIEKWWVSWIDYQRSNGTGWASGAYYDAIKAALDRGEHLCDEDGVLLPVWRELRRADRSSQVL
ncbi:MAG: hypothetical protein WC761_02140 [Candidatus Paceibacterota bacterium]